MSKTVEARMVISAHDRTGRAFMEINRRMKDFESAARRMQAFDRRAQAMLPQQALSVLAAATASIGLTRQIVQAQAEAMKLEKAFSSIGKTAGISAAEAASLGLSLGDAAGKTGRTVADMLGGVQALVAAGNSAKEAFDLAPTMATVANATDATVDDIAKSTSALMQNLGVTSAQILETWDKISATTKAGSFEARDIAQYLPAVSASAAKLGIVGPQGAAKLASALQVVRTGTGDASTAANNLVNLMEKIWSPDTKRNIDKALGPQAWRGFQRAIKGGQDDLTAFVDMIEAATKGDLTKLPAIIPDAQARAALSALIDKAKMYDNVMRSASTAQGTIMRDAAEQAKLAASAFDRMSAAADTLMTRMGKRFNETMAPAFDVAAKTMSTFTHADTLVTDYQDEMEKRTGVRPSAAEVSKRFMGRSLGSDGTPEGGRAAARRAAASDAYDASLFGIDDPTRVGAEIERRNAEILAIYKELENARSGADLSPTAKDLGFGPDTDLGRKRIAELEIKVNEAIIAQLPRLSTLDPGTFATPDEVIAKGYADYGKSRAAMPRARPELPLPKGRPTLQPSALGADPSMIMDAPAIPSGMIVPPKADGGDRSVPWRAPEAAAMSGFDAASFASSAMDDAARKASTASAEVRALFEEMQRAADAAFGIGNSIGAADIGGAVSQSMAAGRNAIRQEGQAMETEAQATMERIRRIFSAPISVNVKLNAPGPAAGLNRGGDISGNGMAGSP